MNDENDNSLAARIAALCAKAQKADELEAALAAAHRAADALRMDVAKGVASFSAMHKDLCSATERNRKRGERIVELIRENIALKREVETLRKQVAEYEAVNEPEPSPSLLDMVCATRVYTDEEWQDWVDAAYERNRS